MILTPENWTFADGIGFLPLGKKPVPYGLKYFQNYQRLAETKEGFLINDIRCNMVISWWHQQKGSQLPAVLDVGIGAGAFVSGMRHCGWDTFGSDVNPFAIKWLESHGWLHTGQEVSVLTFWDVLEHIEQPKGLLDEYKAPWIFLSMPIYEDEAAIFKSKHFKPGEHCWYFTQSGLALFMQHMGYQCVEVNKKETVLVGRDEVFSFAFKRHD